ncbi:MAG: hypothetical protein Q8P18_08760 [Pseudomonadota bacterium]|nr:hypothetical protein [Pseudomonadota bacterium]
MDWAGVTARVVVEACSPTPEDIVLYIGDDGVADVLAPRVRTLARRDALVDPPPGLSIICLHGSLRRLLPGAQRALIQAASSLLPPRGLLVVGDVMWSFPKADIDAPEQFGDALEHVQTTATIEAWCRAAGFLPDLHRFGPGVAVLIAIRGQA